MNKQPWQLRVLLSAGLLMVTMPLLLKEYLPPLPDFARGVIEGIGIVLETSALVLMRRSRKCGSVPHEEMGG